MVAFSIKEALKEIEDYLDNSFPSELKKIRTRNEASALEAKENAKKEGIKKLEKEA